MHTQGRFRIYPQIELADLPVVEVYPAENRMQISIAV